VPSRAIDWGWKSAQDRLSRLAGSLKGVSARRRRHEFPGHIRTYLWGDHFRSPSYFAASCGGAPLSIINEYIENQKRPGRGLQCRPVEPAGPSNSRTASARGRHCSGAPSGPWGCGASGLRDVGGGARVRRVAGGARRVDWPSGSPCWDSGCACPCADLRRGRAARHRTGRARGLGRGRRAA
jgi:hypothetical protein